MKKPSIYLILSLICLGTSVGLGILLYNDPNASLKEDIDGLIKNGKTFMNDISSSVTQMNDEDEVTSRRKNRKTQYVQSKPKSETLNFVCDGRQHCSQMRSCDEARFFIRNCPNTKMDGDGDGKPCEQQCGH